MGEEAAGAAADRDAEIQALGLLRRRPPDVVHHLLQAARLLTGASEAQLNVITSRSQETLLDAHGASGSLDLADAVCPRVLLEPGHDVAVADARADPRFADAGVVESGGLVGYAASKLVTSTGVEIGTVCVFSEEELPLDEKMTAALQHVAAATMVALEARRVQQTTQETLAAARARSEELHRSNEHLVAFASQVGHDIQGPLATVSLSLELLDEQLRPRPVEPVVDVRDLLRPALAGVRRLQSTVKGLLDFALVGGHLRLEQVDLTTLAHEVVTDLEAVRGRTTVEVHDLPEVLVDTAMMRALLLNLVGNAFKHAGGGDHPLVRICAQAGPHGVRVVVEDNGPGVPEDQRERVFGLLVRGDSAVAGSVPGLGIGLATCARIAQLHGGRLGVDESALGGARFWLELATPEPVAPVGGPVAAVLPGG